MNLTTDILTIGRVCDKIRKKKHIVKSKIIAFMLRILMDIAFNITQIV